MTGPVAVTGAAGFVGQTVIAKLLDEGHAVRALIHRRALPIRHPMLEIQSGGLHDDAALETFMAGSSAVIHIAGVVRGRTAADFNPVNVEGVGRAAGAAHAAGVGRFILISSLAAREPQLSPYAASKRAGEEALSNILPDTAMDCVVLRPPAIYGAGDVELLPLFRLMARGITPMPAQSGARASLLHVDDLAAAVLALLRGDARGTYALHDGHEGGYEWDEIAGIVEEVAGRGRGWRIPLPEALLRAVAFANLTAARILDYQPMLTPGKVNELRHADWVCDNQALTQATGWRPKLPLREGLAPLLSARETGRNEGVTHVI
jgi:nucleoside-diphosphate-sugar epimerase